jgi:hypothetical protein
MSAEARDMLRGPAVGLKIAAAVGGVTQIASIVFVALAVGVARNEGNREEAVVATLAGSAGMSLGCLGIAMALFLWIGAGRMAGLRSYGLSMATGVVALIPCLSPCCVITLPFGIWALFVMARPEVKSAFTS